MAHDRVLLVRHGQTEYNSAHRWQGHVDIPLNETGRMQAKAAGAALVAAGEQPTRVVSSDLMRAVDTARVIAECFGLGVQPDPQLREVNAGNWEGKTKQEILRLWPQEYHDWYAGKDVAVGRGERISAAAQRGAQAVLRHVEQGSGTLLVVAHGGMLRGALQLILGLEFGQLPVGVVGNGHWGVLFMGRNGAWRLESWNVGPPAVG
ncbi:MAG: phosphoglycerate mutase [Micrococcales bacterium]|nr:MAG: phosphoglycerate mutase [Micrococcales bacterium]